VRVIVTGAAGFIGSHLVDRLLAQGHQVLGFDAFTETYSAHQKAAHLNSARAHPHFALRTDDLLRTDLEPLFDGAEVLFHLAGQPGVRESWGDGFSCYAERNVVLTERVLDAARRSGIQRVVFASSSSVYGAAPGPTLSEDLRPAPVSPYGVTKLAAEELCFAYHRSHHLPVVVLRYFTAYGPRQRPDMAFSRFIAAMLANRPLMVYGDGSQRRDFTFVDDVVSATICAAQAEPDGRPINVGSGVTYSICEVLDVLGELIGHPPSITFEPTAVGDMPFTHADLTRATQLLGYAPTTDLRTGLQHQLESMQQSDSAPPPEFHSEPPSHSLSPLGRGLG
jgi:nucleoside-diphosphate-sugar epimerase